MPSQPELPPAPAKNSKHFDGLDGLRGAAALLVFLSHASASQLHLFGIDLKGIGKCGVALFFILSAHLLTLQFLQKAPSESLGASNLRRYFIRRFMRIFPLYFVYLTTALVTTWISGAILGMNPPDGIPLTLAIEAWMQQLYLARGDGVTWSIVVEFKYYFILPLIAWGLNLIGSRRKVIQFAVMVATVAGASILWPPQELLGNDLRLRSYLGIFLAGSFCGLLASHWEKLPEAKHSFLGILSLLGLAFILATSPPLVKSLGIASEESHYPEKWMFAHGLAFVPVLFCAAYGNGLTNRIFSNRFLRFVGMVSFSLYLWHPVFTQGASRLIKHVNPMVLGWVALVGTLVASYISYRMIEMPFLKLGTKSRPKSTSAHG